MKYRPLAGVLPALFLVCLGVRADAQCETDGLNGNRGRLGVRHGYSCLALQGDTLAVSGLDQSNPSLGPVWLNIFTRSGPVWSVQAEISRRSDALALDGDTLVLGDHRAMLPGNPSSSGSAAVYVRTGSTWSLQQELPASVPREDGYFGYSVAISGDTIVVGQPGTGNNEDQPGDAHVFVRSGSTWSLQTVLTPSDRITGHPDLFGNSVAIEGDRVVVGCPRPIAYVIQRPGAVFVFDRSGTTWAQTATFAAPVPTNLDGFGVAVALDGGTMAVGEYGYQPVHSPAVHVFVENASVWGAQAEFPVDGARSVALQNDLLLVEVLSDDFAGGGAYLYERSGTSWSPKKRLYGSICNAGDAFGTAIALDGQTAAVVAPNTPVVDSQVFLYDMNESGCPRIAFAGSPTSGLAPLNVSFSDLSTGSVSSWSWDFGDGNTSNLQNPGHVYGAGLFTVDVVVSGPGGTERWFEPDYIAALLAASAMVRNGTNVNNTCYSNLTLPLLGANWDTQIDHSGHPGTILTLVAVKSMAVTGPVISAGEILVGDRHYLKSMIVSSGTSDTHSLAIPADAALAGIFAATQSVIFDNLGGIELCNAIDLVLGY